MTLPTLPDPMTLPALQDYVARMVEARRFYKDPDKVFILLTEEVGELARELRHRTGGSGRFDRENLGYELADILLYLLDLANGQGLNLMEYWPSHEAEIGRRPATPRMPAPAEAGADAAPPLNALAARVAANQRERRRAEPPEQLMIRLTEAVGEIATELRKRWKARGSPGRLAREILAALTTVMHLARCFAIDLERAVAIKEARNAGREWEY